MISVIGYIALTLNISGNMLLAHKNIWGWIVRLVTNITWILYAVQVDNGEPMALNHIIFFGINIYGFIKWRRERV